MKYELIYRRSFVALSPLLFVGAKKETCRRDKPLCEKLVNVLFFQINYLD